MDNLAKHLLQRLMRRIPASMLQSTLDKWGRLTAEKRKSLDFTQSKLTITQELVALCEESELTVKHITELEMIYVTENPNQGMWHTFQLLDPEDDAHSVELMQFKEQFKSHLSELKRNVSVKIKKHTDEAVWIRVAWGDGLSRPNHLKATYVVHYLQTPYVFVNALSSKNKPLLLQALTLSTKHQQIKAANLSGQKLTALRDLLMRQYQQVFPTKYPSPLPESDQSISKLRIEKVQAEASANRHRMAGETFGDGMLPALQSAFFQLETKFKDPTNEAMTQRDEPFICSVKFSSSNLLESLRHCASSGIASTPVTPLLSSIPLKGRNYFVITNNVPNA
ncbi:PREDICTED: centromere protein N isoform X1 [Poecilia mexicana]|uniref:Centromere protein N n=1 Tax=Poecilia mexicana TaxID=48701 RepID=A0A3B3WR71_9TELE|nr:PREDICTED: centromere protein N isoform X1 [Poecilia mexicana]